MNPQVDEHALGITYAQRPLFFHNLRRGRFEEIGWRGGAGAAVRAFSGRPVADFNNDGARGCCSPISTPGRRFCATPRRRGALAAAEADRDEVQPDGYGVRLEVLAGGLKQMDEVRANSSFLSASDLRLHFGLGAATSVEQVVIHWPSGAGEDDGLPVDREKW